MAMVVLTNQQKEEMKNHADFKEECKWAILNKAVYWKGLDGSSVPGNDHIKWAKSRQLAAALNYDPTNGDPAVRPEIVDRFLLYVKNIACVDDQTNPFSPADVVTWLVDNDSFEALADNWFDDQIATNRF